MSLAHNLIDEHVQLLKSKGYDEESLNSPIKPGTLAKQLAEQVWKAINKNLHDRRTHVFELATCGFFNKDADIMFFKFSYLFDVNEVKLDMSEMAISMNKVEKILFLDNELPEAKEVYKLFKENMVLPRKSFSKTRFIDENGRQRLGLK